MVTSITARWAPITRSTHRVRYTGSPPTAVLAEWAHRRIRPRLLRRVGIRGFHRLTGDLPAGPPRCPLRARVAARHRPQGHRPWVAARPARAAGADTNGSSKRGQSHTDREAAAG